MTIELPPDLAQRAREEAAARGESVNECVLHLIEAGLNGPLHRAPRRKTRRQREAEENAALSALLPHDAPIQPPIPFEEIRGATRDGRLVRAPDGDRFYEYHPVTEHIVSAPRMCGGRLTIKDHRLDAGYVLGAMERGKDPEQVA